MISERKIEQAKKFSDIHFASSLEQGSNSLFPEEGWRHILKVYGGRLPLEIRAVPEGSVIPTGNVLFTVENTDPEVPWLVNWFETLLVQCWYPTTVATLSRCQKEVLAASLMETADTLDSLPFMLHDFGFRGCSSVEVSYPHTESQVF